MMDASADDRRFARTLDLLGGAGLLYLLSRVLSDPLLVNHDCGALLFAGRMLLEGKLPYVDFYELNPPLIDYLQVVPVLLGRFLPLPLPLVFNLMVLATVGLSWWLTRYFLVGSGLVTASTGSLVAWAPLLLSATTHTQLWAQFDFGQREHFFMLLAVPYVVLRWRRWEERPVPVALAALVGLGAGMFASLKPFLLAALLAPEVLWVWRHRRLRPLLQTETVVATAFVILYGAHFLFLPGPMKEAYFHRWLPLIVNGYGAYGAPLEEIASRRGLLMALAAAALPFLVRPSEPTTGWRLAVPLSLVTLGGAFGYLIQQKGWSYHLLPAVGGGLCIALLVMAEAGDLGRRMRVASWAPLVAGGLLALALTVCLVDGLALAREGIHPRISSLYHAAIAARSKPGDAVLFIDSSVVPQHPTLIQLDRRPGSRYYGNVFTLPMLYRDVQAPGTGRFPYRTDATMPPEERRLLRELAEDIERFAPHLVFVPVRTTQALPRGFSVFEWLETTGWVEQSLRGYEPVGRVGDHLLFSRSAPTPTPGP
jgi:hypothetical protein